jgi:hypothetical protein
MDKINTLVAFEPNSLIGTWRRFGALGPVYEVIGQGTTNSEGEMVMRIHVVESGEELDYRLTDLLDDPKDR